MKSVQIALRRGEGKKRPFFVHLYSVHAPIRPLARARAILLRAMKRSQTFG